MNDAPRIFALSSGYAFTGLLRVRSPETIAAHISEFVVACQEARLLGCVAVRTPDDEPAARIIFNLCVDPDQVGVGIGRLLLARVIGDAMRAAVSRLYAATTHAGGWFERNGFTVIDSDGAPASWVADLDPARGSKLYAMNLPH